MLRYSLGDIPTFTFTRFHWRILFIYIVLFSSMAKILTKTNYFYYIFSIKHVQLKPKFWTRTSVTKTEIKCDKKLHSWPYLLLKPGILSQSSCGPDSSLGVVVVVADVAAGFKIKGGAVRWSRNAGAVGALFRCLDLSGVFVEWTCHVQQNEKKKNK